MNERCLEALLKSKSKILKMFVEIIFLTFIVKIYLKKYFDCARKCHVKFLQFLNAQNFQFSFSSLGYIQSASVRQQSFQP